MDLHLQNKVVVITGGTAGIGKASAFAFAEEGAQVVVCSRSQKKIDTFLEEARNRNQKIAAFSADMSEETHIQNFLQKIGETYGRIDVLFNNAARDGMTYLSALERDTWDAVINTNLTSVWLTVKYALPFMKQHGGSIISTSSLAARIPTTSIGVYAVSKGGVNTLTTLLASELAPYHIRVNAISPGVVATEMVRESILKKKGMSYLCHTAAQQRLGKPEEIANTVLFLASDTASFITGEILDVSGGKFIVQDPWAPWEDFGKKKPYETSITNN